ncbi:DUF5908 family protein [Shewanella sp. UCD-KL12]|uniref:DUF5908 family protein n=1 Tax=Shewanella sp. UCD-KL12 TaxID=1917163 RepID=UPI0015C3F2FE|nr:DUF5908 family protein [Shewanella sp. UCD-KL12]
MSVEIKQLVIKSNVVSEDKSESLELVDESDLRQHTEQLLKSCSGMIKRNRSETRER